jgi:tetratricopeptide (TPR) repeat protein
MQFRKHSLFWALAVASLLSLNAFGTSPVRSLLDENRLEDALPLCRQFEVLSSYDYDNLFACTWVYYRSDRTDSAEKLMDKLKNRYSLPEYQLLVAYGKMKKHKYDEARRIITSVSTDHKGTSIALTADELSAEIYEMQGQLDTAAFIYKHVVDDDNRRGRAQWGLGRYYLARGDNRRATYHLEQTTKLWPKHMGSRFNLAVMYLAQNDTADAARWLAECYKLNKADIGVLEQLGVLFEKKGDIREAVKQWQRAVELKPDTPLAKEKLSSYAANVLDNLIEAKKFHEALLKLENMKGIAEQPALLFRRGIVYRNLGKWEKGSVDLRTYLNSKPNDAVANRELGICYLNLKLPKQALTYFNRAASNAPSEGMNHAWLGYVLESEKQMEEASEEWKKAVDLLKDPQELEKATRRLAAIEKKMSKNSAKEKKRNKDEENEE